MFSAFGHRRLKGIRSRIEKIATLSLDLETVVLSSSKPTWKTVFKMNHTIGLLIVTIEEIMNASIEAWERVYICECNST